MATMIQAAKLSNPGRVRDQNEDFCEYRVPNTPDEIGSKGALFVVADGMGGHEAGRAASQWAVTILLERYYSNASGDIATALRESVQAANAEVRELAIRNHWTNAGTTIVCAVVRGSELTIANVGDSRAYLLRGGQVKQLTEDHTWVHERVKAGEMTPQQAAADQRRNAITRSLGTRPDVVVDIFQSKLEEGDALLLCTDGLTGPSYGPGPVKDGEIGEILGRARSSEEATKQLIDLANHRGGPDNITVVVLYYGRRRSVAGAGNTIWRMAAVGLIGLVVLAALSLGILAVVGGGLLAASNASPPAQTKTIDSSGKTPAAGSAGATSTPLPTSTLAPSAVAASPTPVPSPPTPRSTVATATPAVTTVQTTSSPRPTDTQAPAAPATGPTYSAPVLLEPENGLSRSAANDVITLRWSLAGGLQRETDYFFVHIRVVDNPSLNVNHYTKDTWYQVPTHIFDKSSKFEWSVITWRQTGSEPKVGSPAGAQSETRTFFWKGTDPVGPTETRCPSGLSRC